MIGYCCIFQSLPFPLQVIDLDYKVVEATDTYLGLVDKTREQLLGQQLFEIFPPPIEPSIAHARVVASFSLARREDRIDRMEPVEWPLVDEDGVIESHVWQVSNAPVHRDGEIVGLINHVEDVTARFRQNEKERELASALAVTLAGISTSADELRRVWEMIIE